MNAINLDITDDLRDFSFCVQHSEFYMQQALSRKYCRLLSQQRQSLGSMRADTSYVRRQARIKFNRSSATKEPHLRRYDFTYLFGKAIAHDVFGRIN